MKLILASLILLTHDPELVQSYCDARAFHGTFRCPEFTLDLEGRYASRFALSSLKKLPVKVPGIGEAIATLGWGGEPCLFVERRGTLLRLCFETPAMHHQRQAMVMQMMPAPDDPGPAPGIERGFVTAFEAGDAAALVSHPFARAAAWVVGRLDAGEPMGVTRRVAIEQLRAEINGRERVLDRNRLPAALGDRVVLRIVTEVTEHSCTLDRPRARSVDPEKLSGALEQGRRRWTGVRDGAALRFELGPIESLRRQRYRVEADGERITGELLHRYGQAGETRLASGTEKTALAPPPEINGASLRDLILREIEGSYDSDRHRLGVRWVQPALRAELVRRGKLSRDMLALLAGPPEEVLLHGQPSPSWHRQRQPLRYSELRLSGPYADTFANPSDGPDVIWEEELARALWVSLRFNRDPAVTARLAGFLKSQLARQIEPTTCVHSKNRQCVITTDKGEGHAWALLALRVLASRGDREAAALATRVGDHIAEFHLGAPGAAAPTNDHGWQDRVRERLLLATAVRPLSGAAFFDAGHPRQGRAEYALFEVVGRGYSHLRLELLADLYDYLDGSGYLIGEAR